MYPEYINSRDKTLTLFIKSIESTTKLHRHRHQ